MTSKSDAAPPRLPAALGGSGERSSEERGQFLPWRIVVHFSNWPDEDLIRLDPDGRVMHDAFINSVKEADFVRNGTAKGIMSLSKEDSDGLWNSVQERMFVIFLPLFPLILLNFYNPSCQNSGIHINHITILSIWISNMFTRGLLISSNLRPDQMTSKPTNGSPRF